MQMPDLTAYYSTHWVWHRRDDNLLRGYVHKQLVQQPPHCTHSARLAASISNCIKVQSLLTSSLCMQQIYFIGRISYMTERVC